jgi:hypothetical protein
MRAKPRGDDEPIPYNPGSAEDRPFKTGTFFLERICIFFPLEKARLCQSPQGPGLRGDRLAGSNGGLLILKKELSEQPGLNYLSVYGQTKTYSFVIK